MADKALTAVTHQPGSRSEYWRSLAEAAAAWLVFTVLLGVCPLLILSWDGVITKGESDVEVLMRDGSLAIYGIVATGTEVGFRIARLQHVAPRRGLLSVDGRYNLAAACIVAPALLYYHTLVTRGDEVTEAARVWVGLGCGVLASLYTLSSTLTTTKRLFARNA